MILDIIPIRFTSLCRFYVLRLEWELPEDSHGMQDEVKAALSLLLSNSLLRAYAPVEMFLFGTATTYAINV